MVVPINECHQLLNLTGEHEILASNSINMDSYSCLYQYITHMDTVFILYYLVNRDERLFSTKV